MESCTPEGGEKKKPPEGGSGGGTGESKSKRKMKTASQLELLEKTYAVETYPSEALRLELSGKLGLTDRQLQMWFCHRRLKDRKVAPVKRQKKDTPPLTGSGHGGDEMMMGVSEQGGGNEHGSGGSGSGSSPFEPRKGVSRTVAAAASAAAAAAAAPGSRIGGGDMQMVKRYYEPPPQPISELRAIAFVEAQLGESLREDGPILGMEFDPLPPGAFGAPIAITGQQKQTGRSYDGKMYDRHDAKTVKTSHMPNMEHGFVPSSSSGKRKLASGNMHVGHPQTASRALHEYQFLPEQPSARSDTYERIDPSHFYTPPLDGPNARVSSLSTGGSYLHGKEQVPAGYGFQGPMSSANVLSQQGRQGHIFNPAAAEYESVSHRNLGMDVQMGGHPIMGLENPLVSSDRRVCQEDDATRVERKRKIDEARIAREVEAHEKRIRKELEKQDILRRKREEQMRREMEKHDRERRKEEERLMREKQREEERFQREQKRELERRERFLQKENLRAEKMRQKEELRKEKEAARLKAANERATARRIAKESMELIEDERLELMELAVLSKGLPSIISLDSETLQNLDSFRDMLVAFPPKSVNLKKPFGIQPWIGSEENIGNLLMVWRFLITFADVLELWPFTLDEFVQAFHDYDPRLLGEIHVALLRSIIKDIEDVARTPSIGLGGGQNSSANPGGGHPQIVEGAYAWGFDIRSWQRHLNPLTWPEILRQFALSAGFGPQLKKRRLEQAYFRDDNEGNDGEDIVSTLRNGAAAENAAAVMQEKGFSNPRRSRHRLTPGTVKFAAFHVLSLEGSKGLTILEVAEKIQKSGLRDLTTSKTPEASIAAALSRDSNLFERTAPSTYCVRAAYRKDPSDAEAILSAAREKIQIFENGFSDSEEAEKEAEDVDDVERDEDSECELAEDPEVDDMGMTPNENKSLHCSGEVKFAQGVSSSGNEKRNNICTEAGETLQSGLGNAGNNLSSFLLEDPKEINNSGAIIDQSVDAAIRWNEACNPGLEDKEIDESNSGEPWVQGLMEADYSDLSVEERLNALVALIGVAIEGNSIRLILEERLEAANALKKQMWAEAQLDKRRLKEEYVIKSQYPSSIGIKAEGNVANSAVEGSQSPFGVDNKNSETPLNPAVKHEEILDTQNAQNYLNSLPTERNMLGQEVCIGADTLQQQHVYAAAEKSRAQLKAYIGQRAEEMYVFRSLPLGQDRRRNRYWQFVTSASKNDPGSGRIFFESQGGYWRLIDSEEAFDTLLASLDTRGIREAHLHSILQKIEVSFKEAVQRNLKCKNSLNPTEVITKIEAAEMSSSPDCTAEAASPSSIVCGFDSDTMDHSSSFRIELGKSETEKTNALKRYQDFQKWMWKECCNSSILSAIKYGKKRCPELLVTCDFCHDVYIPKDNHCPVCHRIPGTFSNNIKFSGHMNQCEEKRKMDPDWNFHNSDSSLPLRIRLLKAQLALTEVSVPPEALQPLWAKEDYRNSWGLKLQSSLTAEDLLQNLTLLEGAIKRDYLSSNFETTKELLGSFMPTGSAVGDFSRGSVPILPWVPQTTAAVALRLLELDASISYMPNQKVESHKDNEAGEFFKVPSKYTVIKNIQEAEPAETPNRIDYLHEENWIDMGSGHSSSVRGRGIRGRGGRGRNRGGRWPKSVSGGKESSGKIEKMGRKSQTRGRGGRRRGRRTVRSKQKPEKRVVEKMDFSQFNNVVIPKQNNFGESPISSGGEEEGWEEDERRRRMHVERDEHSNSIEASESDDNGQASGDEYDVQRAAYMDMYNGKPVDMMEESNGEEDEDDDDEDRDGYEDEEEADVDGEDVDMDIDMDREGLRNVDGDEEYDDEDLERNVDGDEGTESGSSDYSD